MPMMREDFGRRFMLDVCAAGSVTIRERGAQIESGLLPVFSVDTHGQAEAIRVRHCRRANDGSGLYFLNDPPKDVDDLGRVADLFRAMYDTMGQPPAVSVDPCEHLEGQRCARCAPEDVVLANDLREGRGTHHPRVRVVSIDNDGDAACVLVPSGHRKTIRVVTLAKAYRLIERNHGNAAA